MTYYHASPAGGLQMLEPRKSPYFDKPTQKDAPAVFV